MPNWTTDQLQAINDRKHNLLVSAAAGSGKTAVLVERIIRLITEDLLDIDKLLIVTFTKAAAGEMRDRILEAISKKIEEDTKNKDHLKRQLTLLNKASITTLHSFCTDIIRKNFHVVGLDHSFRVADVTERSILIQEVLDEVFEQEYQNEKENFIKLVEGYGSPKNDIKLQGIILKIFSFIQSKPYPEQWLESVVEFFSIKEDEFEDNIWVKCIKESILIDLEGAGDLLLEALQTCRCTDGPSEYEEAICDDLAILEDLRNSIDVSIEDFFDIIDNVKFSKFKAIRGSRKDEIDEIKKEEVKELRDIFKKKVFAKLKESILRKGISKQVQELNSLYPLVKHINYIIKSFSDEFSERKLEKNILDFNDLEHYALKVLENKDVRSSIRDKYDYIFVDEYQDSNIVQETIINRIKREDNLFLVGDVKQSIYRFRMADPSLFIEKYNSYKDVSDVNKRIILSKNFRSREDILNGVNYIFKNIMYKEIGEIDYTTEAYLNSGMSFEPIEDSSIEVNIIPKTEIKIDDNDELELTELKNMEIEAKAVAKKIKELIGSKTYRPKDKCYKEIEYKDIVVLLRATRNTSQLFVERFIEEGIPVYADDNLGYFETIEIKLILNLLSLIDNKRDDLALVSVMRSAIGGFDIDELIKIRINHPENNFYNSIVNYEGDEELTFKIHEFIKKIDEWSGKVRYMKLDEFIWDILIETGYYYYVGAMKNGSQKQANLRILVSRANQFEKSSIKGLFNFIRFIDKMRKSGSDMSPAKTLGENENVVRIMSIHKSKGLEFPVVICAGLGKKFNLMDTREEILLHKDLGIGPKYVDIDKRTYYMSLPQAAIKRKIKIESLAEEMRILYVALTRAVDKLILYATVDNLEKSSIKWCRNITPFNLINSNCYLDWIMLALTKHKDGESIRQLAQKLIHVEEDVSKWTINILSLNDLIGEDKKVLSKDAVKNELINFNYVEGKANEAVNKRFSWTYSHEKAVYIPAKISVTAATKASFNDLKLINHKIPALSNIPRFASETCKFTGAQKGTIVHYVMQHINLEKVNDKESIKNQIDDMVFKNMITTEEAKVVDSNIIYNFFNSNLGKRMLESDNILRETPFVMKKIASNIIGDLDNCSDELYVQGIIDCCFEENGEFVLIDYKTDFVTSENLDIIAQRYKNQIYLYKEALERIRNMKVKESYIYLFNINRAIKIE